MQLSIVPSHAPLPDDRPTEIVERKGRGHPDTVCDALAEALSVSLSRFYLEHGGRILHHNVDKVLLAAGASAPRFGGGSVTAPIRIHFAGRAAADCGGTATPIAELADETTRRWLAENVRALDVERHVVVESLVRPGSSELVGLFDDRGDGRTALANDTSCGVGYAPLSEVERVALAVERCLTGEATQAAHPAFGEDVKVMAVRHPGGLELTVACAMIDGALRDAGDYAKAVEEAANVASDAARRVTRLPVRVAVNVADDVPAGRMYLTVTGTSAEAGDDGQAGRGNRVNGLITPGRSMTIESVAGKNPVTHVGKLYNLGASLIAERIVETLPETRGAECRLVSRIGRPVCDPWLADVRLTGADPVADPDLRRVVERVVHEELERLPDLAEELVTGRLRMDRWPLRA